MLFSASQMLLHGRNGRIARSVYPNRDLGRRILSKLSRTSSNCRCTSWTCAFSCLNLVISWSFSSRVGALRSCWSWWLLNWESSDGDWSFIYLGQLLLVVDWLKSSSSWIGSVGAGEACGSSTHPTCIPPFLLMRVSRWLGVVVLLFIGGIRNRFVDVPGVRVVLFFDLSCCFTTKIGRW